MCNSDWRQLALVVKQSSRKGNEGMLTVFCRNGWLAFENMGRTQIIGGSTSSRESEDMKMQKGRTVWHVRHAMNQRSCSRPRIIPPPPPPTAVFTCDPARLAPTLGIGIHVVHAHLHQEQQPQPGQISDMTYLGFNCARDFKRLRCSEMSQSGFGGLNVQTLYADSDGCSSSYSV